MDSGISPGHPHVGSLAGGVSFAGEGEPVDRLGHGTAVAGAIRQWAPEADLYAVKVFDRRLSATIETLLQALEWCRAKQWIWSISVWELPTRRIASAFLAVLDPGTLIVSPATLLPGSLPGVDWSGGGRSVSERRVSLYRRRVLRVALSASHPRRPRRSQPEWRQFRRRQRHRPRRRLASDYARGDHAGVI